MKKFLCASFASMALVAAHAGGALLVSAQEMQASNAAPETFSAKSVPLPDAPLIELLSPRLDGPIGSPTPIRLKFQAAAQSKAKPESFKVLYGSFQIDITKRLLSVAKVTEQGVEVNEANLPAGKHKLLLSVEDSAGRLGNKVVEFVVQ
ncbi:MAG: hypothetical protein ACR2I0_13430 [Rhodoferax sp.]